MYCGCTGQRSPVNEGAWTLMIGGGLVIGSVLFMFLAAHIGLSAQGVSGLAREFLLLVDGRTTATDGSGGVEPFLLMVSFGVFAASLLGRFPTMIRHLRVLPLGATRLNLLLIAWPAAVWLAAGACRLVLHYLIVGEGVRSYQAGALLGLIGVSALIQAMTIRFSPLARLPTFAALFLMAPLLLFTHVPGPSVCAAVGAAAILAAAVVNRQALARHSTYAPTGLVFGIAPVPR